ncbi:MAG TPA: MauE/DoxX family redox-associated membrane protein [Candidatus Binatia bacterium]|nr:MauE/DoxX family redox-associated membrane protein [Candidatus Binatia bacterium]
MRRLETALLWLMAAFYVASGIGHFAIPQFYLPMMPPYLPWHLGLIYVSGVAEIVLGVLVLVPRTRRLAAWGIILLLIAVFPANVHIALDNVPLGGAKEGAGALNWIRLPLQAVLIAWAWWYTGEREERRGVVPLASLAR